MNQVFNAKKHVILTFDWTDLLSGSVIGAVITEVGALVRKYFDKRNVPSENLKKFNEMYNKGMKPVLDNTAAERFLIWKAENGGGSLYPGAEIFVSVLYEDYRRPLHSVQENFQRWLVDKTYLQTLMDMSTNGIVKITVEGLPESKLKTMMQGHDIAYTEFHFLAQTKTKLFFATISTTNKVSQYAEPHDRAQIDVSINHLRNIFKKTAKYLK